MPFKTFLAINFFKCVMVACAEHLMKLRFNVLRDVDIHSKQTFTWKLMEVHFSLNLVLLYYISKHIKIYMFSNIN